MKNIYFWSLFISLLMSTVSALAENNNPPNYLGTNESKSRFNYLERQKFRYQGLKKVTESNDSYVRFAKSNWLINCEKYPNKSLQELRDWNARYGHLQKVDPNSRFYERRRRSAQALSITNVEKYYKQIINFPVKDHGEQKYRVNKLCGKINLAIRVLDKARKIARSNSSAYGAGPKWRQRYRERQRRRYRGYRDRDRDFDDYRGRRRDRYYDNYRSRDRY